MKLQSVFVRILEERGLSDYVFSQLDASIFHGQRYG